MAKIFTTLFILIQLTHAFAGSRKDSVGVTKLNGKMHIRYMVSPGETIYRISTKYKVPISDLIDTNPELEFGLKTGQIINIPINEKVEKAENVVSEPSKTAVVQENKTPAPTGGEVVHTVEPGETFFSIAKKYNISIDELLKANNVSLKAGQRIVVKPKPSSEAGVANNTPVAPTTTKPVETPNPPKKEEITYGRNDADDYSSQDAIEYNNAKKHLLVIPFDPYLYFSDADDEISATSKIQRTKVRQAFRRRLSALLDPQGYETINLLGGKAKDSITDLNKIYSSVTYSYQEILYSPNNNPRLEKHPEKGLGKATASNAAYPDASTQTSRASLAKDPGKYFGVKINNPQFFTYFNNKYKVDYYLFINQFEVKTNYENCLDRATLNYERGFITHYSIFDKNGKQIAGNRIYTDYNSNSNNIQKILADNMQKVADRIMADLPK